MAEEEKKETQSNGENESKVIEVKVEGESLYGKIPSVPSQEACFGIRYDFNDGLRILFPQRDDGKEFHLSFFDGGSNLLLYDSDVKNGTSLSSTKKYLIRFKLVIRDKTDGKEYEYMFDLKNKKVVVQFPVGTIGDTLGWFSYLERFKNKEQCELYVCIKPFMRSILEKQYPDFHFVEKENTQDVNPYATYCLGLFFGGDTDRQPQDFREIGLHRTAGMILGLRTQEELEDIPPRFDLSAKRQIKEKYVCIATKASAQCKHWNNPNGWNQVIAFLKENGYRVLCMDKDRVSGMGYVYNQMPWGVEDFTGDRPLQERIDIIKDADFFIGLGSGLSWIAWGCRVPVVLLSGFSLPHTEFYTPYRIINYYGCNGCWDDMRCNFDHSDFFQCPRHKGDDRQFECTKFITGEQVIDMIKTIPEFKPEK